MEYAISGQANGTPASLGVSINWKDNFASADGTGDACVNPSTGSVVSDASLACTVTGTDITTDGTATIASVNSGHGSVDDYLFPETLAPSFTNATDIFTAITTN